MSNFSSPLELYRRTGDYVDKILRGAKPADIPDEQPTKIDLVVNLTTQDAWTQIPESPAARRYDHRTLLRTVDVAFRQPMLPPRI